MMLNVELVPRRPDRVFCLRLRTTNGQQFMVEAMKDGRGLIVKADGVFAQGGKPGEILIMTVSDRNRTLNERY